MTVRHYQIILRRTSNNALTLRELALHAGMHPGFVERLVEFGLITAISPNDIELFDPSAVARLQTIARLRGSLGVNLAGISVILDLVDKVCVLQRENRSLRNRS
jgi:DNA-binding transcriptional MerR regulator